MFSHKMVQFHFDPLTALDLFYHMKNMRQLVFVQKKRVCFNQHVQHCLKVSVKKQARLQRVRFSLSRLFFSKEGSHVAHFSLLSPKLVLSVPVVNHEVQMNPISLLKFILNFGLDCKCVEILCICLN